MNISDVYTLKIEKMLYEGKALARINNIPVFIDGGCPGDIVKVKISAINKSYLSANIIEILENSKYRIKPFCALHNVCGSCNWQYIDYNEQLEQKRKIVQEAFEKIADEKIKINPLIPSPLTKKYRCKIQLPVAQTKNSKRLLSGYYKRHSHELINIKNCPMQPDVINQINEFLKEKAQELQISGYDEKFHTGLVRHIIYRISSDLNQILIIFVINSNTITCELEKLSELLIKNYPQITGICANFNTNKTNVILSQQTKTIMGNNYYIETLENIKYKISSNSFFQVNPLCAAKIFNTVKEIIFSKISKPTVLDAYSGVSSFGIWLSPAASSITCIEEAKSSSLDAEENIRLNNIKNIKIINGDAAVEFRKLSEQKTKFDISIIDPPRKGCSIEAINILTELTSKYIIYVSCNPATLARDIKSLKEKGFRPVLVQPFDMFPHTYHIETLVLFEKEAP